MRGYAAAQPHVAPESLDELTGPTVGEVVLPTRLDWGPVRSYRLDDPADLRLLYERVIREALRIDDLRTFLNRELLISLWPTLFLPAPVRALWEQRFTLPRRPLAA
jgi:hypothetical protein